VEAGGEAAGADGLHGDGNIAVREVKVALATSAILSCVLNRSVPGARLVVVDDAVVWLVADSLRFAHPINPTAGATSKTPAIIAGFTIGAAHPGT
jgi:hypothetical protein